MIANNSTSIFTLKVTSLKVSTKRQRLKYWIKEYPCAYKQYTLNIKRETN